LLAVRTPALVVVDRPADEELDPPDWFVVATVLERLLSFSNDLVRVPADADPCAGDCGVLDGDGAAFSAELTAPDTPDAPFVNVPLSGAPELCADTPALGLIAR
jgi:hypothetical protein